MKKYNDMKRKVFIAVMSLVVSGGLSGQSVYPGQHSGKLKKETIAPMQVKSFDLKDVRLLPSRFRENMMRDSMWMASIEVDRLLHSFRTNAGVFAGREGGYMTVKKLGGWESLDCELRGHTTGHLLSAYGLMYAATGSKLFRHKGDSLVSGLAEVQNALGNGYLSAYPEELINRNIRGTSVWAVSYTHLLAHKAYLSAIAYDAVYNDLSSSERKEIAEGLKRLALDPCLGDWVLEPARIHSLNSMGHNWWTSCACMGGILALSLQNELPEAKQGAEVVYEALPQWFDFAGDVLQQKPKSFDADGGMYESLNYANFGIQEALQFRLAWMNTHPGQKPVQIPQLDKLSDFFVHVCYPRTGILYNMNFGDSHKNVTAESTLMLLYAMGIRNDNMLWYMNQVEQGQHRDGYFIDRPMGFLYTPDLSKAPQLPEIKKSQLFADFGWATMRTSWEKDATMLAVKSGHTWNHSHADANSFIIFHKGVDIIKDAGNCWYPNPSYRNYFFQSEAHNVVLFNGKGQSREQQYHGSMLRGYLHYLLDADNVKYVLANGTGPYSDQFSRNFRHFLWIDDVIYMIDDLKTHDVGHFEWLWHPGGEAEKRGIDLNITNGNSSVVVRLLYPRLLAKSDFVHDYPEDLYWEEVEAPTEDLKGTETYYSFHLPAKVDRVKGLTAIILKETPDQKDLPYMERREGKDWIGLRIHYKGKITDLYICLLYTSFWCARRIPYGTDR